MFLPQFTSVFEMLPELGEKMGSVDSNIDENFPHIAEKIISLWGSTECMDYLDSLINYSPTPDRPNRQGFPFYALVELNAIMEIHQQQFPMLVSKYKTRKDDLWNK